MQRDSQKDRTVLCRYDPTEVGDYVIVVKWSEQHVPGSPFHVHIFDTQEELSQCLVATQRQQRLMQNGGTMNSKVGQQYHM